MPKRVMTYCPELSEEEARTLCKWVLRNITAPPKGSGYKKNSAPGTPDSKTVDSRHLPEEGIGDLPPAFTERKAYVHNAETDAYVFQLPDVAEPVVLPGTRIRQMVSDYSNLTGSASTVNEIARAHGLPRGIVIRILRALGTTHDSLPFTPEHAAESSIDALAEEAGQLRALEIHKRLERDKWRKIQEDATHWRRFEAEVMEPEREFFRQHAPRYQPPRLKLRPARSPYALILGITDEHWGKYAPAVGGDCGYDRAQQRKLLLELIERMLGRVVELGRPEKIIMPACSDDPHIDTKLGTTTAGTPQEMDGTPAEIALTWRAMKCEQIDLVAQVAPVEVWYLPGNHNEHSAIYQFDALQGWMHHRRDIIFRGDPFQTVIASTYGNSLVAMHHGDKHKVRELSEIVPKRFREAWGQTRWHYCWTGHYHTAQDLPQKSDLRVIRWPSPSGTDTYHREHGWDNNQRAIAADVIDAERGRVMSFEEPVL